MSQRKVTIVGAGNVGATAALIAAPHRIGSVVLIDIVEGLAKGKALDLAQASSVENFGVSITGTTDWAKTADSDIVIITSGMPRKPGMSRDDLLEKNTAIVKNVTENVKKYSPDAFIIVVCNPLDAMVYAAAQVSGFDKNKIMGMAGALDTSRFNCFIADELGVNVSDVQSVLMGGHGDDMVPLPRFTSVCGTGLTDLLDEKKINELIERTRKGGIEIVNLLGYSAYYAPAAGAVKMAKAILDDNKSLIPCCVYCDSEYNAGGFFVGVPAILGAGGVEKIVELKLNEDEKSQFDESLSHVKQLTEKIDKLLK